MPNVSLAELSPSQRYRLITGSVMPRPIALITTLNANGTVNAAPYSAFNYMSEDPPLLAVGVERYGDESHRPGEIKDTLKNITERGEFVVNMVDAPMLERMVACGSDYPADISEVDAVGFTTEPSGGVTVPRLCEAPVALECRRFHLLEYSQLRTIVLGEIVSIHFRPGLLNEETLRVNVDKYFPFGRLGGPNYAATIERVRLPVPTYSKTRGTPRS